MQGTKAYKPGSGLARALGVVGVMLALAVPVLAGNHVAQRKHATLPPPVPPVTPAAVPPPPLTLEQQPASPPQVVYVAGQLTITAQNATLGEVLRSVRTLTGAVVEIPGNAPERVVGRFGPGPAPAVLASLLNGSRYNYVVMGSPSDPNMLLHVIVSSKSGGDVAEMAANAEPGPPGQAGLAGEQVQADPADGMELLGDASDDAATDPEQTLQPEAAGNADAPQEGQFGATPPRSPQQMLQDLQRQQLQQQQGGQAEPARGPLQPGQPPQPNPPQ